MKAYELLERPEAWTQGSYGRDASGRSCGNEIIERKPSDAVCWCVDGALMTCYYDDFIFAEKRRDIRKAIGGSDINSWNDAPERTHAEVVAVLKELDI